MFTNFLKNELGRGKNDVKFQATSNQMFIIVKQRKSTYTENHLSKIFKLVI